MTVLPAGFVSLDADESITAVAAHPELNADGITEPVVFLASAGSAAEASDLADLIAVARAALRDRTYAVQDLMRTLLPAERLTIGAGVLRQVERNAQARQALAAEFGLLTSAEVAAQAGSKAGNAAAMAHRWRTKGDVFAVEVEGNLLYPGFQFDDDGRPLPTIATLIGVLSPVLRAWELALWFTGSNARLGGLRPVDAMVGSDGDRFAVVSAAEAAAGELAA